MDIWIKFLWIPAFHYMLVTGNRFSETVTFFTTYLQILLPPLTFIITGALTLRIPAITRLSQGEADTPWGGPGVGMLGTTSTHSSRLSLASVGSNIPGEMRSLVGEVETFMRSFRSMVERLQYNLAEIGMLVEPSTGLIC